MISSCNSDCNDCGAYTTRAYFLKNGLSQSLEVKFYLSGNEESVIVDVNQEVELFGRSIIHQSGLLNFEPFIYDSAYFVIGSVPSSEFYSNQCDLISPVCEGSYELSLESKNGLETFLKFLYVVD